MQRQCIAGNEQPHVLLTFKMETVETNISVCLCLESDLQSHGAGVGGGGGSLGTLLEFHALLKEC